MENVEACYATSADRINISMEIGNALDFHAFRTSNECNCNNGDACNRIIVDPNGHSMIICTTQLKTAGHDKINNTNLADIASDVANR